MTLQPGDASHPVGGFPAGRRRALAHGAGVGRWRLDRSAPGHVRTAAARARGAGDERPRRLRAPRRPASAAAGSHRARAVRDHPPVHRRPRTDGTRAAASNAAQQGVGRHLTAPVSAGLSADTGAYFDALTAYREGDLAPIIRQVSGAVFSGLANGRQLLDDLRAIRAAWNSQVSARRNSGLWRVMDLLLRHPVVNASLLARELCRSRTNVYGFLDRLEDAASAPWPVTRSR